MFTINRKDSVETTLWIFSLFLITALMNTNTKFRFTPLAIGAFILSVIAGLLIFLTVVMGMTQPVQVWLSFIFVLGVVVHTALNWKQFT